MSLRWADRRLPIGCARGGLAGAEAAEVAGEALG